MTEDLDLAVGEDARRRWRPRLLGAALERVPVRRRPVLVFGCSRSGTTWFGRTLDRSDEVLYCHEPTNPNKWRGASPLWSTMHLRAGDDSPFHERAFDRAFRGGLAPGVSWGNRSDLRRRLGGDVQLVVKDVGTSFGLPWIVDRYDPRIVVPIRHPGGVARSMLDHGSKIEQMHAHLSAQRSIVDEHFGGDDRLFRPTGDLLASLVAVVAIRFRVLADDVLAVPDARVERYEAFADDPVGSFQSLFAWIGLEWPDGLDGHLRRTTTTDEPATHSIVKDAAYRANRWRNELDTPVLAALRDEVATLELPWNFPWPG